MFPGMNLMQYANCERVVWSTYRYRTEDQVIGMRFACQFIELGGIVDSIFLYMLSLFQ